MIQKDAKQNDNLFLNRYLPMFTLFNQANNYNMSLSILIKNRPQCCFHTIVTATEELVITLGLSNFVSFFASKRGKNQQISPIEFWNSSHEDYYIRSNRPGADAFCIRWMQIKWRKTTIS